MKIKAQAWHGLTKRDQCPCCQRCFSLAILITMNKKHRQGIVKHRQKVNWTATRHSACCKALQIRRWMGEGESRTCTDAHSLVVFSICTFLVLWTGFEWLWLRTTNLIEALEETQATLKTETEASWNSWHLHAWSHFTSFHPCADFLFATLSPAGGATSSTRTKWFTSLNSIFWWCLPQHCFHPGHRKLM